MNWSSLFISGSLVWIIQLTIADLFTIDTIRPDFIGILIVYWAVKYGRFLGTLSGLILGIIVDLSGSALFFGLSPLIYTFTGYLSGNLNGMYTKMNPLIYNFSWISILLIHFLIFCTIHYQEILIVDIDLFFGKWIGTSIYTISFLAILQFIVPLSRLD